MQTPHNKCSNEAEEVIIASVYNYNSQDGMLASHGFSLASPANGQSAKGSGI